jgi:alpha-L-fucosidase
MKKLVAFFLGLAVFIVLTITMYAQNNDWQKSSYQDSVWNARGCFNDAKGQWFRDAKFGTIIHFGLYSQLGGYWKGKGLYDPAEQIIGLGDKHDVIPCDEYVKKVGGVFNPVKFNAAEWVSNIKKAGQKYLIITTKHHDGFCMFNTKTTKNNVVEATPFKRDIIKELADECQKQGLVFGLYYSIGDWCESYVKNQEYKTYKDYMFAQLKELLTNYSNVKLLWFDNYWYVDNQWEKSPELTKELYAYVHSINPDVLINDRCGSGDGSADGDYATPENQLKGSLQSRYFEVVMTDTYDDNWGWVKGAKNYRLCSDLISNLIDCTSKGGNFVLNVGPTATGEFPPEHIAILDTIGKWLTVNGEAIYGAVPYTKCSYDTATGLNCRITKKSNSIFVHILNWPKGSDNAEIRIEQSGLVKAELLDSSLPRLKYESEAKGEATILKIHKPEKVDFYATVVKVEF